jgi:hypothetical protein
MANFLKLSDRPPSGLPPESSGCARMFVVLGGGRVALGETSSKEEKDNIIICDKR